MSKISIKAFLPPINVPTSTPSGVTSEKQIEIMLDLSLDVWAFKRENPNAKASAHLWRSRPKLSFIELELELYRPRAIPEMNAWIDSAVMSVVGTKNRLKLENLESLLAW